MNVNLALKVTFFLIAILWLQLLQIEDFCPKKFRTFWSENLIESRPAGIELRPLFGQGQVWKIFHRVSDLSTFFTFVQLGFNLG
jgi:hypothetical protein